MTTTSSRRPRSRAISSSTACCASVPGGPDVEARLAAGELEPARVDAGVGVLPGDVERVEVPAADPARVPDRALGGDVEGLGDR